MTVQMTIEEFAALVATKVLDCHEWTAPNSSEWWCNKKGEQLFSVSFRVHQRVAP